MLIYLDKDYELKINMADIPATYWFANLPFITQDWVTGYSKDLEYLDFIDVKDINLMDWFNEQSSRMKQINLLEKL